MARLCHASQMLWFLFLSLFFHKLEVRGDPASGKSVSTIFPAGAVMLALSNHKAFPEFAPHLLGKHEQ